MAKCLLDLDRRLEGQRDFGLAKQTNSQKILENFKLRPLESQPRLFLE